ncbi:endonuclease domain-containing protein [Pseudoxanthomonas japonensis]
MTSMLLSMHTDIASPSPLAGEGLGRGGTVESRTFAKQLRRNMTDAEHRLWKHLRAHRLDGQKFHRQQPIGPCIVHFVHFGARVVVEADGGQHVQSPHDAARDAWLMRQGFRVLRFWNDDILLHTDAVLESIWKALRERAPSPPAPLPQWERGEQPH